MLKNQLSTWVKNVYTLRIVDSKNSVGSSPLPHTHQQPTQFSVHNPLSIHQLFNSFTTVLSTIKTTISPPLIAYLYPQSTPPTIRTKKEKMER